MDQIQNQNELSNFSEKVSIIASKLAVNKYNAFHGKINLDIEISGNIELVNKKISQIYKKIESKMHGVEVPRDLNDTIAEYLLRSVVSDSTDIDQLDSKGMVSEQIFTQVILKNADEQVVNKILQNDLSGPISAMPQESPNIHENRLEEKKYGVNSSKFKESEISEELIYEYDDLGVIRRVFEDGSKIVVIDPKNTLYKIHEGEPDEVEEKIMLKQMENEKLYQNIVYSNGKIDLMELTEEYKNGLKGIGIDAALREMYGRIVTKGAIEFLRDDNEINQYDRDTLFELLDAITPENSERNDYQEDSYTMVYKLGIFSRFMNDPMMACDEKYQAPIKGKLKNADSELYDFIERNPLILEQMQTVSRKGNPAEAMIEILQSSKSLTRDEFFEELEEFSKDAIAKGVTIDKNVTDGYDKYEAAYNERLTQRNNADSREEKKAESEENKKRPYDEQVEEFKQKMKKNIDKSGIGSMVMAAFSESCIRIKGDVVITAINELLDFDNVDKEENYIQQIEDKDIELMHRRLNSLIENQSDDKTPYIMSLGQLISRATEMKKEKVLSANKTETHTIVNNLEMNPRAFVEIAENTEKNETKKQVTFDDSEDGR